MPEDASFKLTRRGFLRGSAVVTGLAAASSLIGACSSSAPAPAKPAETKPAADTKPAETKPAAEAKPAGAAQPWA